ncbi:MAG: efflux transporter outer membrane subunit [Hyphomicrobiales bacterium]|nr:efflux transporter outer membrane subunit [Hyphomicrobiales bacterium]
MTSCAAVLAVCGCALAPDDPGKLTPDMPQRFSASGTRPAPPVPMRWPSLFGSRELTALSRIALEGNYDLEAAVARILQADAQARIAGAALYPQIEASGNASRRLSPGTTRSPSPPFRASVSNSFSFGLSASYVVDFWGRNARLAEAGKLNAMASRHDYDTLTISTLAALSNAYFQVLVAQERLRYARNNIRSASRALEAIRARVAVGTNTALDVAQQESVLANQRANVPVLEQQLQQSRNVIAVLLGRAPQSMRVRGGSLRRLRLPRVRPGLPSQLLLRRPDIAAAEARLKAAGANIVAARAALYPNITLTGDTSLASQTLRNLLRPEAVGAAIAGSVAQSIFSGYNLESQVDLSRARRDELLAAYRQTILTALSDVENALIAIRKTAEQERLRAAAVRSAERAATITRQRLLEGTIDVVTLLNTQQTLFNAQDAVTLVRFQRLQAIVSLFQALGGGFSVEPGRERMRADRAVAKKPLKDEKSGFRLWPMSWPAVKPADPGARP